MTKELDIKLAELKEAYKSLKEKVEQNREDIKELQKENVRQSEEIKDSIYLTETLNLKFTDFSKNCSNIKSDNKEIQLELREEVKDIQNQIQKGNNKKLLIFGQIILNVLVTSAAVVGSIFAFFNILKK